MKVQFLEGARAISHNVMTGCGHIQPLMQWVPRDFFFVVEGPEREADQSPLVPRLKMYLHHSIDTAPEIETSSVDWAQLSRLYT
jgi:hypothetical protein